MPRTSKPRTPGQLNARQIRAKALKALREKEKGAGHYEKSRLLINELVAAGQTGKTINLGKFGEVELRPRVGKFVYFDAVELKYSAKGLAASAP